MEQNTNRKGLFGLPATAKPLIYHGIKPDLFDALSNLGTEDLARGLKLYIIGDSGQTGIALDIYDLLTNILPWRQNQPDLPQLTIILGGTVGLASLLVAQAANLRVITPDALIFLEGVRENFKIELPAVSITTLKATFGSLIKSAESHAQRFQRVFDIITRRSDNRLDKLFQRVVIQGEDVFLTPQELLQLILVDQIMAKS